MNDRVPNGIKNNRRKFIVKQDFFNYKNSNFVEIFTRQAVLINLINNMENQQHYVCGDHQNYCTLVCINPECTFKPLCEACISRHPNHHMSEIVPLDQLLKRKMIMPSIFAQAFHKLKQTVFSLQMQLNNKRLEDSKRLLFFCDGLKKHFEDSLKEFYDRGNRYINQTYENFPKEISDLLQKINEHEIAFDPNMNSPFFTSQRVENSMKFHSQYRQTFFPNLEQEVTSLEKNIEGTFCEVNEEKVRTEFLQILETFFKKHDVFKISKIKKLAPLSKSQKTQKEPNALIKSAVFSIQDNSLDSLEKKWTIPQSSDFKKRAKNTRSLSPNKYLSNKPQSDFGSVILLGAHIDIVNTICVIPDTDWVFSGGGDKIIKQWDYNRCYLLKELKGHIGDIWSLVYIGEGNFIASASSDKSIKIWNVLQGTCIKTLVGHFSVVRCLVFDDVERTLISGSADQSIKVWDIYSGICRETIKAHHNIVRCMCWTGKLKKLVSGGGDGSIKIWDFNKIERDVETLLGHSGEIWSVIYIEELKVMLSAGTDKIIRIWDLNSLKILRMLIGHGNIVNKILYLKDEKRILSSSSDLTMKLWNINSGQNIRTFNEHEDVVSDMAFAGGVIITASWDRNIKKWSLFD